MQNGYGVLIKIPYHYIIYINEVNNELQLWFSIEFCSLLLHHVTRLECSLLSEDWRMINEKVFGVQRREKCSCFLTFKNVIFFELTLFETYLLVVTVVEWLFIPVLKNFLCPNIWIWTSDLPVKSFSKKLKLRSLKLIIFGCFRGLKTCLFGVFRGLISFDTFLAFSLDSNWWNLAF